MAKLWGLMAQAGVVGIVLATCTSVTDMAGGEVVSGHGGAGSGVHGCPRGSRVHAEAKGVEGGVRERLGSTGTGRVRACLCRALAGNDMPVPRGHVAFRALAWRSSTTDGAG